MGVLKIMAVLLLAVVLAACGKPSKKEIIDKAEAVNTKGGLESALGQPDNVNKIGPIEQWFYEASDGQVMFVITGNTVVLETAGGN